MMKARSMVQWTEHNQNNRFVNPSSLPWLSESSGAVHLAQPGHTAGSQADDIQVKLIARLFFKVQKFTKQYDFLPIPTY